MKKMILACLMLSHVWVSNAQNIAATAGGEGSVAETHLEFTVGETFTATVYERAGILTQGFHQPRYAVLPLATSFPADAVSVFPNPTDGLLHVQFQVASTETRVITLVDLSGKTLFQVETADRNWQTDLSSLPGASYLLQIQDLSAHQTTVFKILKSN